MRLRHDAGTPQGERNAAAVSDLFDLALTGVRVPRCAWPPAAARRPARRPRRWPTRCARPTGCDVELVLVETTGDRRQDVPLHVIGGQGVFVKEVQQAVLDGRADAAVHSAKDLPSIAHDGAGRSVRSPRRRDPADALDRAVARPSWPEGATVATGSVRRRAQLAAVRPDLHVRRAARQHRHPPRARSPTAGRS